MRSLFSDHARHPPTPTYLSSHCPPMAVPDADRTVVFNSYTWVGYFLFAIQLVVYIARLCLFEEPPRRPQRKIVSTAQHRAGQCSAVQPSRLQHTWHAQSSFASGLRCGVTCCVVLTGKAGALRLHSRGFGESGVACMPVTCAMLPCADCEVAVSVITHLLERTDRVATTQLGA